MPRDGLGEVLDLVCECPFGNGAVDERPQRPGDVVAVVGGVEEEMCGEVEGAGRAECTDQVGVGGELGV